MAAKNKLTDEQQRWIVERFACFSRDWEIMRDFEARWGEPLHKRLVNHYNVGNCRDRDHAKQRKLGRWWDVFQEAREAYRQSTSSIAIADATYRVQKLDEMFAQAMEKRNFNMAARLLEQAAKETGGAFTNRRQIEGELQHAHQMEEIPREVMAASLGQRIREAVAQALESAPRPAVIEGDAKPARRKQALPAPPA